MEKDYPLQHTEDCTHEEHKNQNKYLKFFFDFKELAKDKNFLIKWIILKLSAFGFFVYWVGHVILHFFGICVGGPF